MSTTTCSVTAPREREVLFWLGEGKLPNEIATILGISVKTVST